MSVELEGWCDDFSITDWRPASRETDEKVHPVGVVADRGLVPLGHPSTPSAEWWWGCILRVAVAAGV